MAAAQKLTEYFPEGSLVCMIYDQFGRVRESQKDQLPGKVVGILKSSPNRDEVELLVSMAKIAEVPSQDRPGKKQKIWVEGDIQKKKGKDLLVFAKAFTRAQGSSDMIDVEWKIEDLPFEFEKNERMPEVWKFLQDALAENPGLDGMPLDAVVNYMYTENAANPHTSNMWRAWLQVKNDHYFYGSPELIKCHTAAHVEEKEYSTGSVNITDTAEHEDRTAARKAKSDKTKEARKRVLQIMMLRNSPLLKVLADREISNIANKAELQRYEKGEEVVTQGVDGGNMCVVVAGELDAIQRFGEWPFLNEESQFVLSAGNTFAEEAVLHVPSRLTVRALKPVEIALIEVHHCEFLVNESPDALAGINKLLNWQEDHKPIFDLLMQRKSLLLRNLKDHELKALSKYVTLRPITRDTLLCREGAEGKSMYIMVRGYARAYNDIELTDQMKERRRSSLKNIFELERLEEELKAKVMERLELGGQGDVIFNEKAVAVFGRSADDDHKHRHQVNLYRAGQCFEESCSTLNMKRMSSVVALQGSVVGEITKSDLNPILLNTPGAHLVLQKHWTGVTPLSLIAEALAKQCPSALVPKLDEFELRWLSVGAKLDDWDQGHKLFTLGKPTYSIFMVMDGELSVFGKDDDGKMVEIAVLGEGKTVGEVGLIVGAKATTTVVCKTHCALIEIPAESAEGLILSRPDIVDYIHHVKVLCEDLNRPLELMNEHIEEVSELYKQEMAQESLEDNGTKADPPYFSSWFEGTTVEVVEISPPVYGNAPASRGRYERCDELLDEQSYKQTYRAFDTEWGMSVAWNTVRLSKLSPTIKMQFLTEVATTLILTNEQPSWLRYDLRAQHDGSFKFLTKWEMSKAKEVDEYKPGGLSPRSQPLGEARGHLGLSQTEFEAATNVEAWRALRPWETEKPPDWDDDIIPEKFMSKEMVEAKRNKKERMFHAPEIIKCYNYWEDEANNTMVFITELIEGTRGVGQVRKAFTCLQLGNYVAKHKRAATKL